MFSSENNTERGARCELYVIEGLQKRGFKLLTRNYCIHNVGELDIVMERDFKIYVIEVKARKVSKAYPSPIEAITTSKRSKLLRTTQFLIREYNLYGKDINFLASLVYLNHDGSVQKVEIIPF